MIMPKDTSLSDKDGNYLAEMRFIRAFAGDPVDLAVIHSAIACVMDSACWHDVCKISVDQDMKAGVWSTKSWDESKRYADDVVSDWLKYGTASSKSLHDIIWCYAKILRDVADTTHEYNLSSKDFVIMPFYMAPRAVHPAKEPIRYVYGEGHKMLRVR